MSPEPRKRGIAIIPWSDVLITIVDRARLHRRRAADDHLRQKSAASSPTSSPDLRMP